MSEIRHDPLLTRWVVIAENRAARPNEFVVSRPARQSDHCVFCPGNETDTPAALLVRRPSDWNGDEHQWRIRVVANLYPAVGGDAAGDVAAGDVAAGEVASEGAGLFRRTAGSGSHEVIIDTPRHVSSFAEMSEDAAVDLFDVYRERLAAIAKRPNVGSALVFKNVGAAAGASIEHAHSQILATPRPTAELDAEWRASREYARRRGGCVFCRMAAEEARDGGRVVAETERAIVFCPFASRFPYEMCIVAKHHESRFEHCGRGDLAEVARRTHAAVRALERVLDRPAYNYVIHSAPPTADDSSHYHWHVELYPRITTLAGFELGGGCYINPVSPERAAQRLRAAVA